MIWNIRKRGTDETDQDLGLETDPDVQEAAREGLLKLDAFMSKHLKFKVDKNSALAIHHFGI